MAAHQILERPTPAPTPTRSAAEPRLLSTCKRWWLPALLVLVGAIYALPVLMIFIGALRTTAPGLGGAWTFDGIVTALTDPRTGPSFRASAVLALSVATASTGLASFFAWVAARTDAPLRRAVTPLMTIVLVIPTLFFALAWDQLGKPGFGLINVLFASLGAPGDLVNVTGGWGVWWVISLKTTSLAYFVLIGTFRQMDRQLEEASLMSGASRWRTYSRVTLPVLSPSILGAFIVCAIIGFVALDAPLVIGLPAGFAPLSTQMYSLVRDDLPAQYGAAGTLASIIVVIVIVMVVIRWRILESRSFITMTGKATKNDPERLGPGRWAVAAVIVAYGLCAFVLPSIQLLLASLQTVVGLEGALTLSNYAGLFTKTAVVSALWNTLVLALVGGALAVVVALLIGIVGRRSSPAVRRSLDLVSWFPWSIHGVVLALGLLWGFLAIPFLRPLFGGIGIVLLGLVIASTPLASRAVEGALAQIAPELEEAGRASGMGPARVTLGITVRLILPACLAAWLIAGINIAGNVDVPLLLAVPTNMPVSVLVFELYTNGSVTEAAALYCLTMIAAGLLYGLVVALLRPLRRRTTLRMHT